MKKVIITVPKGKAAEISKKFKDILYSIEEEENVVRVTLFVPDDMLDEMIAETNGTLGPDKESSRPLWTGSIPYFETSAAEDDRVTLVEVSTPDFVISPFIDQIKKRFSSKNRKEEKAPIEKILASIEDHSEFDTNKIILAAIAGIVALIGLFLNNVGVIIGAMLISPLLGPIYALAISIAVGDLKKTLTCLEILGVFVLMLVSIAAVATFLLSLFIPLPLTPEISSRMDSNAVYIVMATLLGIATILALSKGIPEGIAGVAIAAALLPPAVVTGISLVLAPEGAFRALTLTLQNVVGLITGSVIGVVFMHIGPRDLFSQYRSKQVLTRVAWILAVIILLLVILSFLV